MAKVLTMTDFTLIFDDSCLRRSTFGSITAPLYFEFGDYQFPEAGWSDFPVVILGWWLESYSKFLKGWQDTAEFQFMDGPMLVRLESCQNQNVRLQCIEQGKSAELVENTILISADEITKAIVAASSKLLSACDERKWHSDDIDNLRMEVNAMAAISS